MAQIITIEENTNKKPMKIDNIPPSSFIIAPNRLAAINYTHILARQGRFELPR